MKALPGVWFACAALARGWQSKPLSTHRFRTSDMADFTKEWIEHLKGQISGRMSIVKDKMDPQTYDELVTDLAWFTFRFARDPDTKMRKVFR